MRVKCPSPSPQLPRSFILPSLCQTDFQLSTPSVLLHPLLPKRRRQQQHHRLIRMLPWYLDTFLLSQVYILLYALNFILAISEISCCPPLASPGCPTCVSASADFPHTYALFCRIPCSPFVRQSGAAGRSTLPLALISLSVLQPNFRLCLPPSIEFLSADLHYLSATEVEAEEELWRCAAQFWRGRSRVRN